MKTNFTITSIAPFDLLRWNKDTFYEVLEGEYFKQFGKWIEILEADLRFVNWGVKVKILTYKEA